MSSNSSDWTPPEYEDYEVAVYNVLENVVMQVCLNALTCLFLLVIFHPLCILSRSRSAIQIMCSKAVNAFLYNLCCLVNGVYQLCTRKNIVTLWIGVKLPILVLNYSLILHVFMLALNRAHSVFFPINYIKWCNRRLALKQSVAVWALSVGLSAFTVGFTIAKGFKSANDVLSNPINLNVSQWLIYVAIVLYAALLVKLVWHKYCIKSMSGVETETDYMVSTVACIASVCPFLLMAVDFFVQYTPIYFAEAWFRLGTNLVVFLCQVLLSYSEEVCLLAICAEFRRTVFQHWFGSRPNGSHLSQASNLGTVAVKKNNFFVNNKQ